MEQIRIFYLIILFTISISNVLSSRPDLEMEEDTTLLSYLNKADSLTKKEQFLQSNLLLKKAFNKYKEKPAWENISPIINKIYLNAYYGENYQTAINLLEQQFAILDKMLGSNNKLCGLLLHKIGALYYLNEEKENALSYYSNALKIRDETLPENDIEILKSLYNIGLTYYDLNQRDSALYFYKKSLEGHFDKSHSLFYKTCKLISRVYFEQGDFDKGENYLRLYFSNKLSNEEEWQLEYYNESSNYYFEFGEFENVINTCQKAINIYEQMKNIDKIQTLELAINYNKLGLGYQGRKNYSAAIIAFKKADNVGKGLWNLEKLTIGDIKTNLGNTYKRIKNFNQAEKYIREALILYISLNFDLGIAVNNNNLGDLYFDQNQYQKALKNYHQSLPYLLKNFQEKDEYKNPILKNHYIPDKQALLVFLEAKAKTFKALYDQNNQEKDLKAAHQTYQLLDELIDDIRLSYLEDASKSYLVKQAKPIYEKAIGLCLQYHQYSQDEKYLEEAFKYAEKSKAIILLEQIKESRANIAASIPDSVQQKERQLKREIGQIEKQLALQGEEITADSLGKNLREQLIRVKNEYEDLVKNLEKENKEYHQLKYDLETVDIQTIQREVLKEGQQLVEYFVGIDSMYVFRIGKEEFEVIARPLDFDLKAWTDSLRQGIYYCRINNTTTNETCEALDRQYEEYAVKLYQKLITPLNLTIETEEIIFIPDGVLGYIPFDALLTKAIPVNQQSQFQSYPYFGLEKVMSYAFSATFLKELQQTVSTVDNHKLLAFAPSFKIGTKVGETLKVTPSMEAQDPIFALRSSLSPLLFNKREVEQIEANFSGKSYVNQQANKLSFIQEAPNYRYLHIASHGKMNDKDADLSYIAFTQDGDSTNQEELLYLRELYDMDIPADMVVLSACETGIGELQNGEGIISLARGFSYAGAKSIITSLWSVNDQKTTDLMVDFYQNLKEGQTKNYALANAKRDYISSNSATFSHPFYWAGFIPIGNMESVQAAKDWTWLPYALGGMSLLAGFFFWQSKRTKRKSSPIAA